MSGPAEGRPVGGATLDDVRSAVVDALGQMDARARQEKADEKAATARKEALTARVSVAAICLTMLMSFLGFARVERAGASATASAQASKAKTDAEARWAYYQTRLAERGSFAVADDGLARQTAPLPDDDPRVQMAGVDHAEYAARIASIDHSNRQVFFAVQDLEGQRVTAERRAARIDRTVARYDMGTRVLTLAVVLLSVTLLAQRRFLFWVGIGVAGIGAAIAINGYFLLF